MIAIVIVSILWVLGIIGPERASEVSGKVITVLLILGVTSAATIGLFKKSPTEPQTLQDKNNEPGPKF